MSGYFVRRLLLIIPTFLGITLVVFVIMHFVPGGPVERQILRFQMAAAGGEGGSATRAGVEIPQEAIDEIRRYYGFDKPVHVRYVTWLWNVMHLDLGNSYVYQDPVWDIIKARFPISLTLGLTGFLLSYLVCVPLGVLKAIKHGSKFDFVSSALVFMGYAVPGWALGTALLVLFGGGSFWSVFPLGGFRSDNWEYLSWSQKINDQLQHMILRCSAIRSAARVPHDSAETSLMENMSRYGLTAFAKAFAAPRDLRPRCGISHSHRSGWGILPISQVRS